jgi:zinc transport system ATP-binding protein
VSVAYGSQVVLSGIDFRVNAGDYLCVVGENGSGKSTLLRALLRLLPLAGGRIGYGCGLTPDKIGYMPQLSASAADFPAGVREVVLSGCLARRGFMPFYTKNDKETALRNMKRLGIEDLKDKGFAGLSGGQKQRVLLARALCAAERLVVMDEPATGLDPASSADFYALTEELRASGMTIVMVSHDMGRALARASHVLHLRGRQEFFGARNEYLASESGKKFAGGEIGV